jgi:hypothetical protein
LSRNKKAQKKSMSLELLAVVSATDRAGIKAQRHRGIKVQRYKGTEGQRDRGTEGKGKNFVPLCLCAYLIAVVHPSENRYRAIRP